MTRTVLPVRVRVGRGSSSTGEAGPPWTQKSCSGRSLESSLGGVASATSTLCSNRHLK